MLLLFVLVADFHLFLISLWIAFFRISFSAYRFLKIVMLGWWFPSDTKSITYIKKKKKSACGSLFCSYSISFILFHPVSFSSCPENKNVRIPILDNTLIFSCVISFLSFFFFLPSVIGLNSENTLSVLETHTVFVYWADFLFYNTSPVHLGHATLFPCGDKFQLQPEPN